MYYQGFSFDSGRCGGRIFIVVKYKSSLHINKIILNLSIMKPAVYKNSTKEPSHRNIKKWDLSLLESFIIIGLKEEATSTYVANELIYR